MDRRFLPRPIRRWLRRRFKEAGDRPLAEQVQQSMSGSGGGGSGGGSGRAARVTIPLPILLGLLACGIAIGGAQVYRAMQSAQAPLQIAAPGPIGALHTVFLLGGQFFIGTLESVDRGTVILSDVFYLQSANNPVPTLPSAANAPPQRGAQVVRRREGDWHQPDRMAIPIERILMMETVGRDSLVYRWVEEGRARQGAASSN